MAEDPNHPWGTGATTHSWIKPVRRRINQVTLRWPAVRPNSYICHPWCGWSRLSVDFWWRGGRGDALPRGLGEKIRTFLMDQPYPPAIRHTIIENTIWTSWGGYSVWTRNDHKGSLRHLHVTYYPV